MIFRPIPFKKVFSTVLSIALLVILLISCSKKDTVTDTRLGKTVSFEGYKVKDYKLYVGSKDGGIDISSQIKDPSKLFLSYYDKAITRFELEKHDQLHVTSDSIQELPSRNEANHFVYKTKSKDSLFRWNIYSTEWQFYGFKRANGSIEYLRSFYKFSKKSGLSQVYISGVETGSLSEVNFVNDNPYRFKHLQDMTSPADTVLFCNLVYIYK